MIRIYGPEELKNYIVLKGQGCTFSYKDIEVYGIMEDGFHAIKKNEVAEVLRRLDKKFPLHWAKTKIFILPFRLMVAGERKKQKELSYLGMCFPNSVIVLGAMKEAEKELLGKVLAHEMGHDYGYSYVHPGLHTRGYKESPQYKRFKRILGLKKMTDTQLVPWEKRPAEYLAEVIRYFLEDGLFTKGGFTLFDSCQDFDKLNTAYSFLLSLMPPKPLGYEIIGEGEGMKEVVEMDAPAKIIDGRFYCIARFLFEAAGGKVEKWEPETKRAMFILNNKRFTLQDGSRKMIVEDI